MSRQRVTSHEVARRAGVSRTTVSLVLNDVKGIRISPETRARVLQAAQELGYTPNASARSLVSGRTRTIGLILSQPAEHLLVDAFLPQVLYGVSEISRMQGFQVLVETVEQVTQPDAYIHLARGKQIDGLIICGPRVDDRSLPALLAEGFPVVLLGSLDQVEAPYVTIDESAAVARVVEHLINLGHQRIACITNGPPPYSSAKHRLNGFRDAMSRLGQVVDADLLVFGNFHPASGSAAMRRLLEQPLPPSAVFVASDVVAFGAMAALHEAGQHIPKDMAIVGFDDVPLSAYVNPPLTTVRVPAIEQGRRAGELLIAAISGQPLPEQAVIMDSDLIVRHSCGAMEYMSTAPHALS